MSCVHVDEGAEAQARRYDMTDDVGYAEAAAGKEALAREQYAAQIWLAWVDTLNDCPILSTAELREGCERIKVG